MALGSILTQFLSRNQGRQSNIGNTPNKFPMFNSIITTINNSVISSTILTGRKKELMKWYEERSGLLAGLVNKVARDCNESVYFEPMQQNQSGRNKVIKAKEFYDENLMREMFFSQFIDLLVTGESYTFLNQINQTSIKELAGRFLKQKGLPVTDSTINLFLKANDESDRLKFKVIGIPSTTVENCYDEYEIKKFVQRVAMHYQEYTKDQIIHLKWYNVNGRPSGWTPISTLVTQLELDWFMWQNQTSIAKNSGQPDRLYSVEDVDINSPTFKRISQELKKYHQVQNRHGSLLLNGKVTVQDLQQIETMQFKDLGVYIAGLFALNFSIPRSRIPFMTKEANTSEDTGGNSEKDYYDNIEYIQDDFSMLYNRFLWNKFFGVNMRFKKSYTMDEIRETQNQQQRLNNLTFMTNELQKAGKKLKSDFIVRYINGINETLMDEDLEEIPEQEMNPMLDNSQFRQGLQSTSDLTNPSKPSSDKKKQEQSKVSELRGTESGMGKEQPVTELSNKELFQKELEGKEETQRVPFLTFIRLYNEDKAFNREPPRVFMAEAGDMKRFTYKSTDFVYECIVPESEVSTTLLMNFRKVYKINEKDMLEIIDSDSQDKNILHQGELDKD